MSSIIWIEDQTERVTKLISDFLDNGHTVDWIDEPSDVERYDLAREKLREKEYDFLLLDIALEDKFGGIHLYNKLVGGQYRSRWKNTIVWSRYTGPRILEAKYGKHEFPIRVFVQTAGIPIQNVLNAVVGGTSTVLNRIAELEKETSPKCYVCNRDLECDL